MATTLTDEQKEEYRRTFALFDPKGQGYITTDGLRKVLKKLGKKLTKSDLKKIVKQVDTDGNGKIDMDEFLSMMTVAARRTDDEAHIRESFKVFDLNGDGFITKAELREVMGNLGERLTDEEVQDMIVEADADGDGQINYSEFVTMMFSK